MTTKPTMFVKKPFEVEVMRWDGTEDKASDIVQWVRAAGMMATYYPNSENDKLSNVHVVTDYDSFRVYNGDYLVLVARGIFESFKHVDFHRQFQSLRSFKAREKLISELAKE